MGYKTSSGFTKPSAYSSKAANGIKCELHKNKPLKLSRKMCSSENDGNRKLTTSRIQ